RRTDRAGVRGVGERGGVTALASRHAGMGDPDGGGQSPSRGQDPHRHARSHDRDRGRRGRRVQSCGTAAPAGFHLGLGRPARPAAADRARVLRARRQDDCADDEQRDPHRRAPRESRARVAGLLRQPRTSPCRMSTAASERRPLAAPTVLFLLAVAGACWAITVDRMQGMNMGPGMGLGGLGWFAAVWVTMMAAMMLPSLSPIALASSRGADGPLSAIARSAALAAGYLLPWVAFGVLAYALVQGMRSLELGFLAW